MQTVKSYIVDYYEYSKLGQHYKLGEEGETPVGTVLTPDPLDEDCSGLQLSALKEGGVNLVALLGTGRPTAHVFWRHITPLVSGATVTPNDYGFHVDSSGHAYHVFKAVTPSPFTIESGDGTGHTGRHTVVWQNARHAHWGTLNSLTFDTMKAADDPAFVNPWPVMGKGYVGYHARLLKSVLNQVQAAGLTISYSTTGNTVGASTVTQINRFRANHGLAANGVCDKAMVLRLHGALGL